MLEAVIPCAVRRALVRNEAGSVRADEWRWFLALREAERTAENSQKVDDGEFSRQVASRGRGSGVARALADS